jgi:hypothetical protein
VQHLADSRKSSPRVGARGMRCRWTAPVLLFSVIHVAGVDVDGMEVRPPAAPSRGAGASRMPGLRGGLSAKRSRSPVAPGITKQVRTDETNLNTSELAWAWGTNGADGAVTVQEEEPAGIDDQVLATEADVTSELPWRTPSPANPTSSLPQNGWKSWNSAESEPMLKFWDENVDITEKRTRQDYLRKDDEGSGNEVLPEPTEESEDAFLFHGAPGSQLQSTERVGWAKMDAKTAADLHLTGRLPVAVDRDSRDFIKRLSVGHTRTGRAPEARGLVAAARMARAERLARATQNATREAPAPSSAESSAESDGDSDENSDSADLSKVGVIMRGLPLQATEGHVLEALHSYGEVERVLINRAMGFAHVLFKSEEACASVLRCKSFFVLGESVELVRGPNSIGVASKKGGVRPRSPRRPPDPSHQGESLLAARVVGKADETFGTGVKTATYWVHRDYDHSKAAALAGNSSKGMMKDENTIAVYNLPYTANETTVRAWFGRCGAIRQMQLCDIVAGSSRYVLIEFTKQDGADSALAEFDGCVVACARAGVACVLAVPLVGCSCAALHARTCLRKNVPAQ